jgi:hypothetical protein
MKKSHKNPWKVEVSSEKSAYFQLVRRYSTQAQAVAAAARQAKSCKIVRMFGPDGVFAMWLDGVCLDKPRAIDPSSILPPRFKFKQVFDILMREYKNDQEFRSSLVSMARMRSRAKLLPATLKKERNSP